MDIHGGFSVFQSLPYRFSNHSSRERRSGHPYQFEIWSSQGKALEYLVFKNNAASNLYFYLIDITPNGKILAIFPGLQDSNSSVMVPSGKEQDFADLAGLMIEEPGEDTVKLIASQMPLDVALFEQTSYVTRGDKKGSENPLESFLSRSMGNATRGPIATGTKRSQWGTVMFSFEGK